ncbi:MAG TPA: RNA polymerase-binding protein DksA [Steroidobacteraceae bacterium]|nr:RNA polymerase-binding protein DksA [Steroidobacteraceae bacterium]
MSRPAPAPAAEATPAKPKHLEPVETHEETLAAPEAPAPAPVAAPAAPRVNSVASAADDDNEPVEPGSLLAGPRNVTPYIAKRGEQYMSKEQLEHFRQILLGWKRDLMEEVDRTVSHMKDEAANFPDPNDRATQEEEFSLELRTRDRERKLIRKIDEALKRTEDGTYGYCLETGEEIGVKRLEARPVATLSIEAQERRERRERQYGDRDDRYR